MNPRAFVTALAEFRLPSVFNPYADQCEVYDLPHAAQIRAANLLHLLEAVLAGEDRTIWLGRDLGHRGGRRTGVPLTDEAHLPIAARLFAGAQFRRATKGPMMKEQTATVVWKALATVAPPPMLWNVFPLHPHEQANPLSNRRHTSKERAATTAVLESLIQMIRPRRLVAIGRDAEHALKHLDVPMTTLRHPSYGGAGKFIVGVHELCGVQNAIGPSDLFDNK